MKYFGSYWLVIFFAVAMVVCGSCSKVEDELSEKISVKTKLEVDKEDVYRMMQSMYYWYDKVPELRLPDYASVEDVFRACLWTPERGGLDRWSFMLSESQYWEWVNRGLTQGLGITIHRWFDSVSGQMELRVGFVNDPSPCAAAGFKRGDHILSVNEYDESAFLLGEVGLKTELGKSRCVFKGIDTNGNPFVRTVDRGVVDVCGVILSKEISLSSSKVGYLAYKNFLSGSDEKQHLLNVFERFAEQGIQDLILDLRYNGGGDVQVATDMAGYLAPRWCNDEVFTSLRHNALRAPQWDKTLKINIVGPNLNLPRIFIIVSPYTASASELLINGLRPFMEVVLIGTRTEGKPVGMWNLKVPSNTKESFDGRWRIAPICFAVENKWGDGGFYEGFEPDYLCYDDILHPLGESESNVKAALYYIEHGSFPSPVLQYAPSLKSISDTDLLPEGFQRETACW